MNNDEELTNMVWRILVQIHSHYKCADEPREQEDKPGQMNSSLEEISEAARQSEAYAQYFAMPVIMWQSSQMGER